MVLETEDRQALDLLSAPEVPLVHLRRHVKCPTKEHDPEARRRMNTYQRYEPATWWISPEALPDEESSRRRLMGEIRLPPDLKASTVMVDFEVEYSVVLYPFEAVGFRPVGDRALLTEPVRIVTAYADGPRPRSCNPAPGYRFTHPSSIR